MKPSIVIARQRRLSRDTPSPGRRQALQPSYLDFTDCLSLDSEPGSAAFCRRPSSRPTASPAAPLSPAMTFLEGHWSPSSLSDADSTVAGSEMELQAEVYAPTPHHDHRRVDSRGSPPMKSIEARADPIRAPNGIGGAPGKDSCWGRHDWSMLGGAALGTGSQSHLTVRTGRDGEKQMVPQPLVVSGEGYRALMDTSETLSPVPSDLYLTRSGSTPYQDEDGLTLFVNPMAFCDTTVSGDLQGAVHRQEVAGTCPSDIEGGMGLATRTAYTPPANGRKHELRKVKAKMGQQVFPSKGDNERLPISVMDYGQGMTSNSEEDFSCGQWQVGIGTNSSEEWRAHSVTVEDSVMALKSGTRVKHTSITQAMLHTPSTTDATGKKNGLDAELQAPAWADIGIGHFREASVWGRWTGQAFEAPFQQSDPMSPACNSGEHFLFCSKDAGSPTKLAGGAARRRSFLKSHSRKPARRRDNSDRSPVWSDQESLDAAVEHAFRDVKPPVLVHKGSSQSESLQSFSQGNSTGAVPRCWLENPAWDGDSTPQSVCSNEAVAVVSQPSLQQSDGDVWGAQETTCSLAEVKQDAALSRDRHWGGLSIGVLSLLLVLL